MKKVNIQSLSLMMLIAMLYAASLARTDPEILLKEIEQEVTEILNKTMWKPQFVPEIPKINHNICVKNFFCCAEKALKDTGLQNLTRILHQYNENVTKEKGNTNCVLNKKKEMYIEKMLENIKYCAHPSRNRSDHRNYQE